jgi:O-antigen/teichoic acid export membrane protein
MAKGGEGYASGARVLSVGIASTGVVTFAYFSVASYALGEVQYKRVTLLWAVMFVIVSVIYRPIEQLLSRTIAERRALGLSGGHPLRVPLLIQAAFAATFLVIALLVRGPVQDDIFDGSAALYWILVGGVLAYAASYFARGWLAGHQRFGLYGGLVLLESCSRFVFALAAVAGVTSGQAAVALGMAAAPCVSLVVVPWAFSRKDPDASIEAVEGAEGGLSLRHGAGFAVSVLAVMLAEQTLINGAVITVDATAANAALAGVVFSVLLIARAPLQLFQAVQGTLLPHLASLQATAGAAEFARAIRLTLIAIAGFALSVAIGLFAIGPFALGVLFDVAYDYARGGLALLALGVGCHLAAGTLNQAALARGQAGRAAAAWLVSAAAFLGWMVAPVIDDELLRAEVGYLGAAALLCAALAALYRRAARTEAADPLGAGSAAAAGV